MSEGDRRCDWQVIWDIRDASGLDYKEKCFLFAVESRGVMKAYQNTAAENMGMSRTTFYETRQRLQKKGLLVVQERKGQPSWYVVVPAILRSYVKDYEEFDPSVIQHTPVRNTDTPVRDTTDPRPRYSTHKGNNKTNNKTTTKGGAEILPFPGVDHG